MAITSLPPVSDIAARRQARTPRTRSNAPRFPVTSETSSPQWVAPLLEPLRASPPDQCSAASRASSTGAILPVLHSSPPLLHIDDPPSCTRSGFHFLNPPCASSENWRPPSHATSAPLPFALPCAFAGPDQRFHGFAPFCAFRGHPDRHLLGALYLRPYPRCFGLPRSPSPYLPRLHADPCGFPLYPFLCSFCPSAILPLPFPLFHPFARFARASSLCQRSPLSGLTMPHRFL